MPDKIEIQQKAPAILKSINFLKSIFITPANIGAKVRIMGRKRPIINVFPPFLL